MEQSAFPASQGEWERAQVMERVMLAVRRLWFGARTFPLGCATAVVEPGGEMFMCVDGDPARADWLVAEAARRSAYVVATTLSRPTDLAARLQKAGFQAMQAHKTYVLDPVVYESAAAGSARAESPALRGLLHLLSRPRLSDITVRQVTAEDMPVWNAVCWRAFGSRGLETVALREKQQAFAAMGETARWYLATAAGGRPVGTAILYQDDDAAQVLAVGTLPAYRGRGVATALMRRLVADWQESGRGFLFLDTTPGSPAEKLYLQLGFVPGYLREVYAPVRLTDE